MTAAFLHGVEVAELFTPSGTITAPASSVIGLVATAPDAGAALFPLDTPVVITGPSMAAKVGATGTATAAIAGIYDQCRPPIVFVRVDDDEAPATQLGNIEGAAAEHTGIYALLSAAGLVGLKPKILIATGFTDAPGAGGTLNGAIAALKVVAAQLRAIYVVDGPSDTDAAALAVAALIGDTRGYLVDPAVKVSKAGEIVAEPASARVAGVIAASDQANGFWFSPSNQPVQGVVGLDRTVTFSLSDPSATSNTLNAGGVATIVSSGGFKLWGNRSTAADDADFAFLCVRRTWDVIEEGIEAAYLWAMDRPQSAGLLSAVVSELGAYVRSLKARGAVLGGRAFLDPELNTVDALKAGHSYIDYDGEPPAPLERLTFNASRNPAYYADLVAAVNAAANGSAQAA